ncbi:MAG: adenosylcobinamide-phosphate synthase CbiB [Lachnospiraceae bacterium]|nr:adenosylcobinamide-phosphate synthase CbiB [Lachnospiraceae bacterium]
MLLYQLIIAFILDMIFGDPQWLYHPIRLIGKLISVTEKFLRRIFPKSKKGEYIAGFFILVIVTGVSFAVSALILFGLSKIHPWLAKIVETFWMYQILAMKCLKTESMKVYDAVKQKDIALSRKMISYLVGRDTSNLKFSEIIKATVETIAENTCDGVTAPMIFMAIGGAPLGFAYKAVNTLDSMIGYKNDKYRYFGCCSARFDDVVNFIPARMTGLLYIVSAFLCGYDAKGAARIFFRDRNKHLSPNSAQTESACAGALGIQLGGTHDYFGKPVEKPTLGDPVHKVSPKHIRDSHVLMYMTCILCLFLLNAVKAVLYFGFSL